MAGNSDRKHSHIFTISAELASPDIVVIVLIKKLKRVIRKTIKHPPNFGDISSQPQRV